MSGIFGLNIKMSIYGRQHVECGTLPQSLLKQPYELPEPLGMPATYIIKTVAGRLGPFLDRKSVV